MRQFSYYKLIFLLQMQVILYHNQSGNAAFTGDLKQKEVHRAITLHPVKQPQNMHRLHKYVKVRIVDLFLNKYSYTQNIQTTTYRKTDYKISWLILEYFCFKENILNCLDLVLNK